MPDSLRAALRERLSLGSVLAAAAALLIWSRFDASNVQVATAAVTGAVLTLTDAAGDAYDLRESVEHGGFGAVSVVSALALLALGGGSAWVPVALLAVGGWFLLDAVQTARHEGVTVDSDGRDGREVYRNYVARRVHERLQSGSLTRRELGESLDADPDAVDAAVATLRERGVVTTRGSELRVADDETSLRERLRGHVERVVVRLSRPVTLELATDTGDSRTGQRQTTAAGASRSAPTVEAGSVTESVGTGSGRRVANSEQERDAEDDEQADEEDGEADADLSRRERLHR